MGKEVRMSETYSVVLTGKVAANFNKAQVKTNLGKLFKLSDSQLNQLLCGKPTILQRGISREKAAKLRAVLASVGALSVVKVGKIDGSLAAQRTAAIARQPIEKRTNLNITKTALQDNAARKAPAVKPAAVKRPTANAAQTKPTVKKSAVNPVQAKTTAKKPTVSSVRAKATVQKPALNSAQIAAAARESSVNSPQAKYAVKKAAVNPVQTKTTAKKPTVNSVRAKATVQKPALNSAQIAAATRESSVNSPQAKYAVKKTAVNSLRTKTTTQKPAVTPVVAKTAEKRTAVSAVPTKPAMKKPVVNSVQAKTAVKKPLVNATTGTARRKQSAAQRPAVIKKITCPRCAHEQPFATACGLCKMDLTLHIRRLLRRDRARKVRMQHQAPLSQ